MKFNPPIVKSFSKAPSVKSFMMLLSMIIGSLSTNLSAQTVSVDTSNTPEQLVDRLMDASCSIRSNQNISSPQAVGYFYNNNSNFPIQEGVIIRNGNVSLSAGPYTGQGLSSQINSANDSDLQEISNSSGQISTITDVGYLEFDFVPNGTDFNFNFLFASNEYGEWQCGFSDVFAFLLTDLSTGETINLAVIPESEIPVSVKDIRNSAYNSSCNSVNEHLFSTYNPDNPASSVLNMRGYTVVMNASANVIPGNSYRIKLAVGDYNDADFDSAVFIEAGSFSSFVSIGEDQVLCGNDEVTLDTGISDTLNYSFSWSRNGLPISGQNGPSITVEETGIYKVLVTTTNGCTLADEITISDLQIGVPSNLLTCTDGASGSFDLTINNEEALGVDPDRYEAIYYASLVNANSNVPIPTADLTNYQSPGAQTIYIRLKDKDTNLFCDAMVNFDLSVRTFEVGEPDDFEVCENVSIIDIPSAVESQILDGLNPLNYTVTYHANLTDANNGENEILSPSSFTTPSLNTTFWARTTDNDLGCFKVVDFNIGIMAIPAIEELPDIILCDSFTLPPLTSGNYFSQSGGNGIAYTPGEIITGSTRVYIYNVNSEGCSIETSFKIEILRSFEIETEHCAQYTIPTPPSGGFFTQPNGPNGTGMELAPGTVITSSQRIYYFSEFANLPCVDKPFDITIYTPPLVDEIEDVVVCDSYALPNLVNGTYFAGPNGTGGVLSGGDIINSSQTIYIYNDDGRCTNQREFRVSIIDTSSFTDQTVCGAYVVPATEVGGYFTQPAGGGTSISSGSSIDTSTTLYYYVETTEGINCTTNLAIDVTINTIPEVDSLEDVVTCIDSPYILPSLIHGNYFTLPNGQGTPLFAGDTISESQTIYIFNTNGLCTNSSSFEVEIRALPSVDNFTDIFTCEPYILPELSNGAYYTESNKQGVQLNAGDVISTTQTIYIYNDYSDLTSCASENVFTVNVLGVTVDQMENVNTCDSYTLPVLNVGAYFTQPFGQGAQLFPGDVLTTSQTLYIYAENGNRFFCYDNQELVITISNTPQFQNFENIESCGSYTLESFNIPDVNVSYYRQSGGINLIDPADYTLTEPGIYTIHARSSSVGNSNCFVDEVFSVTVFPLKELSIDDAIICVDAASGLTTQSAMLTSGLDPSVYTVNWYLNNTLMGTGSDYEATEAGIYTVETIKLIPDVGNDCNYAPTEVEVKASSPQAKITFLTEPFESLSNIRIDFIDPGLGTYEYQLNNGPFQTSNIFLNIPFGEHTITIRDTSNLCGNMQLLFTSMSHPSFFTPNGDGINDTWNIPDLRNHGEASIKIFDRYGKLIKKITPSGEGWNGLSNSGSEMPSSSYWFTVEFVFEGAKKTYTSYFALKRR